MLRYEPTAGVLRWYASPEAAEERTDYQASCTVIWRQHPTDLDLRALAGRMGPTDWLDLIVWLRSLGVVRLWAKRAPGRLLPFSGEPGPDGYRPVDVAAAWARLGNEGA